MTEDISDFENPDFEFRPDVEGARNDLELAKQKLAESSTDKNQQFWKAIITDYEGLIRQMQAGLRLEAARKLGPFNTWNPEAKAAFKEFDFEPEMELETYTFAHQQSTSEEEEPEPADPEYE